MRCASTLPSDGTHICRHHGEDPVCAGFVQPFFGRTACDAQTSSRYTAKYHGYLGCGQKGGPIAQVTKSTACTTSATNASNTTSPTLLLTVGVCQFLLPSRGEGGRGLLPAQLPPRPRPAGRQAGRRLPRSPMNLDSMTVQKLAHLVLICIACKLHGVVAKSMEAMYQAVWKKEAPDFDVLQPMAWNLAILPTSGCGCRSLLS
ncbi:hypothetical protein GGR56DRAFT_557658 [Xylariaceae sp. FL0804]|nr:hypothetical protein GGR56DRAFT_557658 [Xylariaceae sp. FL0804]